ncbi:Ribosomal_protein S15A [Hexamita inflata]|uniref:Ribosomal protein S15A n=1 Tax=Hexamita inflata TaxID=28002 RepID=A0AA86Q416_9EUKA|nr:Ribosomal protein S15A [Hexamita inflata]
MIFYTFQSNISTLFVQKVCQIAEWQWYQHNLAQCAANRMVRCNILRDALKNLCNAQQAGSRQAIIRPINPVVIEFLKQMQATNYIGDFTIVDDRRGNKCVVNLIGRLNKCAVISPRFDVPVADMEKYTNSLLPSRLFGHVIFATSQGIMDQTEAQKRHVGGKIIGFFY